MLIGNLMTTEPTTLSSSDTLRKAATLMQRGGFRRLPVIDRGRLVGIITDRDIRSHFGFLDSTSVGSAMTANPKTINPRMTVEDAARLMIAHKIDGLPVLDSGKLVGILTCTDVMRAFLQVEAGVQAVADQQLKNDGETSCGPA